MTPEEIQKLRKWAARKMGWSKESLLTYSPDPDYDIYVNSQGVNRILVNRWHPDTDLNQAFMVVERMREEGWICFKLEYSHELTNYDPPLAAYWAVLFWDYKRSRKWATDPNPALAILLAARATEE